MTPRDGGYTDPCSSKGVRTGRSRDGVSKTTRLCESGKGPRIGLGSARRRCWSYKCRRCRLVRLWEDQGRGLEGVRRNLGRWGLLTLTHNPQRWGAPYAAYPSLWKRWGEFKDRIKRLMAPYMLAVVVHETDWGGPHLHILIRSDALYRECLGIDPVLAFDNCFKEHAVDCGFGWRGHLMGVVVREKVVLYIFGAERRKGPTAHDVSPEDGSSRHTPDHSPKRFWRLSSTKGLMLSRKAFHALRRAGKKGPG